MLVRPVGSYEQAITLNTNRVKADSAKLCPCFLCILQQLILLPHTVANPPSTYIPHYWSLWGHKTQYTYVRRYWSLVYPLVFALVLARGVGAAADVGAPGNVELYTVKNYLTFYGKRCVWYSIFNCQKLALPHWFRFRTEISIMPYLMTIYWIPFKGWKYRWIRFLIFC